VTKQHGREGQGQGPAPEDANPVTEALGKFSRGIGYIRFDEAVRCVVSGRGALAGEVLFTHARILFILFVHRITNSDQAKRLQHDLNFTCRHSNGLKVSTMPVETRPREKTDFNLLKQTGAFQYCLYRRPSIQQACKESKLEVPRPRVDFFDKKVAREVIFEAQSQEASL
jgi:hypothetical protein